MIRAEQAAVGAVLVTIDPDVDLAAAEAVVATWLADHPQVGDAAQVLVARADRGEQTRHRAELAAGGAAVHEIGPVADLGAVSDALDVVARTVHLAVRPAPLPEPPELAVPEPDPEHARSSALPAGLLYVVTLGQPPRTLRRGLGWRQELLDLLAAHAPDRLVRLLALGEGIVAQSPLGVPADFGARSLDRSTRAWVAPRVERVDLRRGVAALDAQLSRDIEQAAFEGVEITSATCVLAVHDSLLGLTHVAGQLSALEQRMDLLWVAGDRSIPGRPTAPAGARALGWHPELASEVARLLGAGPRRLDRRLRSGRPADQAADQAG